MPIDEARKRHVIDDSRARRALVMSAADLEALALEWYRRGIMSTCPTVNGECPVIDSHEMQAAISDAFARLWAARNGH